ncbi:MAG: TlpA family protein disulfide reductase [Promethearchaeota archaeon]
MDPKKIAIVGMTLVMVTLGLYIGASYLTFPSGNDEPLTRYSTDRDLLSLNLSAPDNWSFQLANESTLLLSDLRGEVVLVDLMATWCSACESQNTELKTINEEFAGTVVILSLSVDLSSDTTALMANYSDVQGVSWAHGLDTDYSFKNYFHVVSIPSMVLIDADGVFRYFHIGLWSAASIADTIASIL